jgi:HSP20 family protein
MSIIPWKKHTPATTNTSAPQLSGFQQEVNRLFQNFFGDLSPTFESFTSFPPVTVSDNGSEVVVTAEVPGMDVDDIEVTAEGNVLTLTGQKREERRDEKENMYRVERSFGSFLRRVQLPANVDNSAAQAELHRGVLTLRLPKVAGERSRTIKVQPKTS